MIDTPEPLGPQAGSIPKGFCVWFLRGRDTGLSIRFSLFQECLAGVWEEEEEEEEEEGGREGVIDSQEALWWEKSPHSLSDQQVKFAWDQGGARRWDFEV